MKTFTPMPIPCARCGQPRTIRIYHSSEIAAAAARCCWSCGYSRARSHNNQWQTEVDDMAVVRLLAGTPPRRTTRAERQAAVRILTQKRLTAEQIAAQLRISSRTVVRLRTRTAA